MKTPNTLRKNTVLSKGWRFQIDQFNLGILEQWYEREYPCHTWARVTVPGAWDTYNEALWGYEGIGWYSVKFKTTDINIDQIIQLVFARVNYHTKVWLNGSSLGENIGGYLPFKFDVTGLLNIDADNTLTLRVDNTPKVQWLPATLQIEWIHYGGILGTISLAQYPKIYISHLSVHGEPSEAGAAVFADIEITNNSKITENLVLSASVFADQIKTKTNQHITCPAEGSSVHRVEFSTQARQYWSPDNPVLSILKVTIIKNNSTIDKTSERFGIRRIEVTGTDLLLNGKTLFIRGVNRYEEYGKYGPTPPIALIKKDLAEIKKAGVNFIRVHHPQSPLLLTLFDEMGFLMMEELPLNWWGLAFHGAKPKQNADILVQAEKELTAMIRRDGNHPSIIMWSMANECKTKSKVGIHVMRKLLEKSKSLDTTRLATFVTGKGLENELAFKYADLVCYNMYMGSMSGKICHHINQLDILAKQASLEYMKKQNEFFPDKVKLITEFGCSGIKNISGDMHLSEHFQARYLEKVWEAICECRYVYGGVLWSWADYYHHKRFHGITVFGPYGAVTVDRQKKLSLTSLKNMFQKNSSKSMRNT